MRKARAPLLLCGILALGAAVAVAAGEVALRFEEQGTLRKQLDLTALKQACGVSRVTIEADPYYARPKVFLALPLRCVFRQGFGVAPGEVAGENFFLRALDGYVKPASGARLAEEGGYLAFADAEQTGGGFESIDRRQIDPGPFYMVWSGDGQSDPHRYPWPYQLAAIDRAPFEREYPHAVPRGLAKDDPGWRGFAIFRRECVACHAINGEGGRVGPDLNVPRSIVEYRPESQIAAYIRDPRAFRYTTMPSHPHLSDDDLEALLAYFRAMRARKHDPAEAGR